MKGWRDKLQQSFQDVKGSSERIKQQLQQAVQPAGDGVLAAMAAARQGARPAEALPPSQQQQQQPAGDQQQQQQQQQYLRLPVESAKKLRWFDKQDINMLMQLHLREKQELFQANTALRTVLQRRGLGDAALDGELQAINSQVDAMRKQEEGVNQVLVLAAQAEIEHLKEALDAARHEVDHMRRQRQLSGAASSAALSAPASRPGTPHQPPPAAAAQAAGAAGEEERVVLRLRYPDEGAISAPGSQQPAVSVALEVQPGEAAEAAPGSHEGLDASQALPMALAAVAAAAGSGGVGLEPQLLQAAAAALHQLAQAQGVHLSALSPAASLDRRVGDAAAPADPSAAAAAAAAGADAAALQAQCGALQVQLSRLQAQLEAAQQDAAFARDAAERKQQELRARFAEAQQRQGEVLRLAQDSRLDAESRCEAAERRLQVAEGRAARLDSEARDLKADLKRVQQESKRLQEAAAAADARAAAAEAAAQRARGAAEVDAKSLELATQQRARIAELEAAALQHQRALSAARQQAEGLEGRLAAAELAAARAAAEARELEEAAHERDQLAVRLAMLEARLDETRVERGQAESYRSLAQQSEEKRARAEDELLVTARLAASLEARLAQAARDNEALRLEVEAAEARAVAAQQSVGRLVEERWAAAGGDRASWPHAAQDEMENVEARLNALHTAHKEAQAQLREATAAAEADRRARVAAERAAAEAEDTAARRQREAEQRAQRAEAAAAAAAVQVSEFRRALAGVERERDELAAERAQRERAAREAAAAVAAARRRTGDGGLAQPAGSAAGAAGAERSGSLGVAGALISPADSGALPSPLPSMRLRDTLEATDVLYLKNVVLKFIDAHVSGRSQECEVLLPAVATLLRASPGEYRLLREHLQRSASWLPSLPALPALMGGGGG